jgi:hypothetical protein
MLPMSEHLTPPAVDRLVVELQGIFGSRLRSVATYGDAVHLGESPRHEDRQVHTLVIVDELPPADLRACAGLASAWRRRGLATPLLLASTDLRRSLDAFPTEFAQILEDHATVHGEDPLAGLTVADADLRRACETQARSHALHLRESYLECAAQPKALAGLVAASAAPFRALLAAVGRLHGEHGPMDDGAATRVAARAGLDAGIIRQVFAAATGQSLAAADAEAIFPLYLAAAEDLVRHVDAWRA